MASRRDFIKNISSAFLFTGLGGLQAVSAATISGNRDQVKLRFILASDAHYGQPNTLFDEMADTFIQKANAFNYQKKCNFCFLNGDLIHDEPTLMPKSKAKFDELQMPFYVTKGNHDKVNDTTWEQIWKMPVNYYFVEKKNAFILATTSNEEGKYLSPDLNFLKEKLEASRKFKNVFIVIHIPQAKWTANGIETPAFFELLKNYPNIKAVFHGHEHDQDGIKNHENIPYIFDSHIGGSWGTDYHGFRVVEVMKDGNIYTYMMNPDVEMSRDKLF